MKIESFLSAVNLLAAVEANLHTLFLWVLFDSLKSVAQNKLLVTNYNCDIFFSSQI